MNSAKEASTFNKKDYFQKKVINKSGYFKK